MAPMTQRAPRLSWVKNLIRKQPAGGLSEGPGAHLLQLGRAAVAKQLPGPDTAINDQFVNEAQSDRVGSRDVLRVLKNRLSLENPHKQWLAVVLTRTLMADPPCAEKMHTYSDEVLQAVATVAVAPSRKGPDTAQRQARTEAISLLRSFGASGRHALRMASVRNGGGSDSMFDAPEADPMANGGGRGRGRSGRRAADGPEGVHGMGAAAGATHTNTVLDVSTLIERAKVHIDLMTALITSCTETGQADAFTKQTMSDLLDEIRSVKSLYQPMMERLSSRQGQEAQVLLTQALQSYDELEGAEMLYNDVITSLTTTGGSEPSTSRTQTPQAMQDGGEDGGAVESPLAGRLPTPVIHPAFPKKTPPPEPASPPGPAVPDLMDSVCAAPAMPPPPHTRSPSDPFGLGELEVGLQAAQAPSPPREVDPFQTAAVMQDPFAVSPMEGVQAQEPLPQYVRVPEKLNTALDPFSQMAGMPPPPVDGSNPFGSEAVNPLFEGVNAGRPASPPMSNGTPTLPAGFGPTVHGATSPIRMAPNNPFFSDAPAPSSPSPSGPQSAVEAQWDALLRAGTQHSSPPRALPSPAPQPARYPPQVDAFDALVLSAARTPQRM